MNFLTEVTLADFDPRFRRGLLMPLGFLSHHLLHDGNDEPKALPQANAIVCPLGADGEHSTEICIVDGDTLWLDGVKIRLKDFDTPEPQSNICSVQFEIALAHRASDRLVEMPNSNAWTIEYFGRDTIQERRRLATIRVDGIDVGDILIRERLVRRWPDGPEFWFR